MRAKQERIQQQRAKIMKNQDWWTTLEARRTDIVNECGGERADLLDCDNAEMSLCADGSSRDDNCGCAAHVPPACPETTCEGEFMVRDEVTCACESIEVIDDTFEVGCFKDLVDGNRALSVPLKWHGATIE